MKSLTPFIAAITLGLASVFGQGEQPSATPMEETPSTTAAETPAAAPEVETTASPAMSPTPSATASPAATPTKSAASTKTTKTASPTAMASGKKMSVEAALKDNENRWAQAHGKQGLPAVEAMVADDFVGVSSRGKIQNRRGMLAEMKRDKDTYTYGKNEKLDVHRYSNDVAVVVGKYREKGTGKDGKAFDRTFLFTDTWVKQNGSWKCVASQANLATK